MQLPTPVLFRIVRLIAIAAVVLSIDTANSQSTIQVPTNFSTIQSAINAASNGDTVLVAPGTYVENINFNGKAITLASSSGPAVTIIDGNHNGTVVTFNHSETPSSVLSGFTIQNGFQNGGFGAGIAITSASPTISANVITGNHAAGANGIYVNAGSPLIINNTIANNDQAGAGSSGLGGGGIAVSGTDTSPGNPQIINNTIANNSVAGGGDGGGISVTYFSGPLIQGNLVRANSAYNNGGGISLNSYNSPVASDNLLVNNKAGGGGSGGGLSVFARSGATVSVVNNTIAGNSAADGSSGIFTTGIAQYAVLTNNIVVAAAGQTGVTCNTFWSSVSPVFSHNDVYSAAGTAWTAACDYTSNPGNISADPLFLSAPDNEFHLSLSSPAIDAGDNGAANLPAKDYDNNPRISDGNSDSVAAVDLGAFELTATSSAALAPSQLSFASQALGSSSSPQTVTLTSTGSTPFQITSIQITGDFSQSSTCPVLAAPGNSMGVAGGSSCTLSVTFTPTVAGLRAGVLTVNGTNGVSMTVALSGSAGSFALGSLSASRLVFIGQLGGAPGAPQTVTLTNLGNAPLYMSSITISSSSTAFSQTNDCGSTLAAGASCTFNIVFTATPASAFSTIYGELEIYDSPDNLFYSVGLSGTGTDFSVYTSGSPALSAGYSVDVPVSVNVYGAAGTYPYAVSLSCAGVPSFSTCSFSPVTVQPGSSGASSTMTIASQFLTPGGTYTVTITGTSADGYVHTFQMPLTIFKPGITVSPASLSFSPQPVGSQSAAAAVTLTNANTSNLHSTTISVVGPFIQTSNCPSALPLYSSCTVNIIFAPTAPGSASGVLSIQDSIDGLSYSVSLSGMGSDFSVLPATSSLTVSHGNSTAVSVNVSSLGSAFQNAVALSCSGLPAKISCAFAPSTLTPGSTGASSVLTISADAASLQNSTFTFAVVGKSGTLSHSASVQLTVTSKR